MTLKIEAEKFYRTRDGQKVGPMRQLDNGDWVGPFEDIRWGYHPSGRWGVLTGAVDGSHRTPAERSRDLIAEWTDEPAATPSSQPIHHPKL